MVEVGQVKTIQLVVELEYDDVLMEGNDDEAREWFFGILRGEHLELHDNDELGDTIGKIRVLGIDPRRGWPK
jgi:hypothetical protein